jgi:hypothetical protein
MKTIIRQVVRSINPNIRIKFHKGSNESDIKNETIYLNFKGDWYDEETHEHFTELNRTYRLNEAISPEAFIVLHEVGHIESVKNLKPQSVNFLLSKYVREVERLVNKDKPYRLLAREYVNLKLERKANRWVLNYIKANPEMVAKLEKAFQ